MIVGGKSTSFDSKIASVFRLPDLFVFTFGLNDPLLFHVIQSFIYQLVRMVENEKKQTCLKFMRLLRSNGKTFSNFDISIAMLQEEAASRGLDDDVLSQLASVIIDIDLLAGKKVSLVKCLIPRYKLPEEIVKSVITWCLSLVYDLPMTVSIIVIQWLIGLWDYELIDRKVVNVYYDVLFHVMLKKEKLGPHIARLIYVLTKPEDVCRRDVSRLLTFQRNCSKPPAHIVALLSLFKSYKPELVPERIQSVNMESVWRPIPEFIRLALEDARDRARIQRSRQSVQAFDWNAARNIKVQKRKKIILPSIGYFHIGSSIFKDKDAKSIFDIGSIEELGKYRHSIELPCNAASLLANMAGYHLLTYADFQYQSRFSYNLYNTLTRAFILENGKYSEEEIDKFLTMTSEFSRYMQEGILVIKLFFHEYLYYNTGEHLLKLLDLLQWMTSISVAELRENILIHIQNIFSESSLETKCKIIRSLQKLITNLFVRQGLEEQCKNMPSVFLRQSPVENLEEIVPTLTTILEDLIIYGLNVHDYNVILLSEALKFYEQICTLESRSRVVCWTIPPAAVIYGAFLTKSCAILSRVCKLLLRYRQMSSHLRQIMPSDMYQEKIRVISVYAYDIYKALWYHEPFSARVDGNLLRNLSERVIADLQDCDLDSLLSISNHYAVLSYKCTINMTDLNINTKEDAITLASCYYPAVSEFLAAFHT